MENIKVLRQKKFDSADRAQAILKKAELEGRDLTPAEHADFHQLHGEVLTLNVEIMAVEKAMDRERNAPNSEVAQRAGVQASAGREESPRFGKIGARYADLFGRPSASAFASVDEFLGVVHSRLYDPRLMAGSLYAGNNETVPSEGGFAVPGEYASMLLDAALEKEIVRPRAWVTPMKSATKKIAAFDMSNNSGDAPFGGLKLAWMAEAGTIIPEQSKIWQLELIAKKAALLTFVSSELIEDGMSFEQALFHSFVESMAWGLDAAFFTGSGAGAPLGVINDPALIAIAAEGGQTAATINYTNLTKMFARIHPNCVDNSIWVVNNTAIPQLLTLTYPGSLGVPVMPQGPDGKFTMLTRPVFFNEKLPALGAQGDILLVDFSQYAIGLRREVSIDQSAHVAFQSDQTAWRAIVRIDGQGKWNKAITPRYGDPLSWAVALQAR
jgi:HK97 family phage major capsid protein